ncbi:hypothetical protein F4604DRAFT_1791995 [Suillus subluteus]|nr:hypothetical protein F4604DRAFT_1791995 [Suillus subluteus]
MCGPFFSLSGARTPTNRGHFRPWALLHMSESTRAFRFSYPMLLLAGANNLFVGCADFLPC